MPVLPGAEPFRHEGGEVGVLLCHGFTGSPQSLRPWAEYLAERGLTVALPLLPGHGTRWEDMQLTGWQDWYAEVDRELRALRERCAHVFVFGLSMGGALALRLAAKHGDEVSGIVVVNPANKVHGLAAHALPVLRHFVRTVPGITSDIAKEGSAEIGYDKVPLHAAHSMRNFYRLLDGELPQVTQPLLLLHSPQDHVVPPVDSERILSRVSSTDVTEILLEQSYHVATLDHDADRIFEESYAFIGQARTRCRQGVRHWSRGSAGRDGHRWLSTRRTATIPRRRACPSAMSRACPSTRRPPGRRSCPVTARSPRTRPARNRSSRWKTWPFSSPRRTTTRTARSEARTTSRRTRLRPRSPSAAPWPSPPASAGPRDFQAPESTDDDFDDTDEGHFVPPEPPPLPSADTTAKFAWLAVLGGPVLLLLAILLGWDMTWWLATLGIGGFLGGFATLVTRMKSDDEDGDDPGRGAVV